MKKKDNNAAKKHEMTEMEAFNADVAQAKYMARVENGELTEEELENRNAMLSFLGYPTVSPEEYYKGKKPDKK